MSEAIDRLLALAASTGLKSVDGHWSEAFVHWIPKPMPATVREAGNSESSLSYFISKSTPHTPEHEGFIDRIEKVAITFETHSK